MGAYLITTIVYNTKNTFFEEEKGSMKSRDLSAAYRND